MPTEQLPGEVFARGWKPRVRKCFYCGKVLLFSARKERSGHCHNNHPDAYTRDHIIPVCKGGKGLVSNKVDCCKSCNSDKSGLTLEEYRVLTAFRKGTLTIFTSSLPRFFGELNSDVDDNKGLSS